MLDAVTRTLITYLEGESGEFADSPGSWITVSGIHADTALVHERLNVCLYSIEEQSHARNRQGRYTGEGFVRPPLWLRLRYLIVYVTDRQEEAELRLGRVLQVFHSHPLFGPADLDPDLVGRVNELAVRLYNPPIEEQNHIWGGMRRPMRIALYYEVDMAPIEALTSEPHPPVRRAVTNYELLEPAR